MKPVALITGGQRGIGLGISKELAKAGYTLALSASSSADTDAVKSALAELDEGAKYYLHDLRKLMDFLRQKTYQIGPELLDACSYVYELDERHRA